MLFYAHTTQLLATSSNRFNAIIPLSHIRSATRAKAKPPALSNLDNTAVHLPHPADVLNIVLHVAYSLSFVQYRPNLYTLLAAVDAMKLYGLSPALFVNPSSVLYTLILTQAPMNPILVYGTAAAHGLHSLAVAVSSYLLAFPLEAVPDKLVARMGPTYFKRLYCLQASRLRILKRILRPPPQLHPATETCSFENQKRLSRAWDLATASIAWDARAGMQLPLP